MIRCSDWSIFPVDAPTKGVLKQRRAKNHRDGREHSCERCPDADKFRKGLKQMSPQGAIARRLFTRGPKGGKKLLFHFVPTILSHLLDKSPTVWPSYLGVRARNPAIYSITHFLRSDRQRFPTIFVDDAIFQCNIFFVSRPIEVKSFDFMGKPSVISRA